MRKSVLVNGAATFFLALLLTIFVSLYLNGKTPSLSNGAIIPEDIHDRQYTVTGIQYDPDRRGCTLHFLLNDPIPKLSLVLSDASNCVIYLDHKPVYTYMEDDFYQRVLCIPLDLESGITSFTIYIHSEHLRDNFSSNPAGDTLPRIKIALGGTDAVNRYMETGTVVNALSCGIYLAIILITLALYRKKPTESYLIMLFLVALFSLNVTLLTSGFPYMAITHGAYLQLKKFIVILPLVPNMAFSLYLVRDAFSPKAARFLTISNTLIFTLLTLLIRCFSPINLYHIYRWLFLLPTTVGLLDAYRKNHPYCVSLLIGAGICEGMHLFIYLINSLRLVNAGSIVLHIRYSQLGYLFNLLIGMFIVCTMFSNKFVQAQKLSSELTRINENLDSLVEARTQELRYEQLQRQELMQSILHDLRSPVFIMRGCLSSIRTYSTEDVEAIKVAAERLGYLEHLIEDLFLLFSFEKDILFFDFDIVDLSSLVSSVCKSNAYPASVHEVDLSYCAEPALAIWGDRTRLEQMLQNLINNAFRHTPRNGRICISLKKPDNLVCLTVLDNGSGIPENDLPHIFEKFYRIPSNSSDYHSSGLGLYIVNEIVRAHRGSISVMSKVDEGTEFTICFPPY